MYKWLQMLLKGNREKGSIHPWGRGGYFQLHTAAALLDGFLSPVDWSSRCGYVLLYLPQNSATCSVHSLHTHEKKRKTEKSRAEVAPAQSNIDCLPLCHPALLQNKYSLVSLHLCLKSTFCVPFRRTRARCQLLSLLHKWNKSLLCKKWWGHGKRMILPLRQDVIQIPGSL